MLKLVSPDWIRDRLEDGGPTCVKIGQFIANRRDIFGKELSTSMMKLQDKVRPVKWKSISNTIDYTHFSYIDEVPIATASIAQVHRAILKSNGKEVALKIKKPHVDRILRRDFGILCTLFPNDIVKEFKNSIERELDFDQEIRNILTFGRIYQFSDSIMVPKVYPEYSNSDMIVMDYLPSQNTVTRAKELITLFINQLLYENVIHGDLHSGNIGKIGDSIVLYDFGNVIKTTEAYRTLMRDFIYHLQNKDSVNLIRTMETIGMEITCIESTRNFINKFFKYIDTLDISSFSFDPDEIQEKVPVKLDKTTASILRSFSLLEGYCLRIDPTFSYNEILMNTLEVLYMDLDYILYRARKDFESVS
jgi:ubiquinone biosynthesis protein